MHVRRGQKRDETKKKARPEGYMPTPITVKLLDRFLLEHASEYDEDLLEFEPESEAEEIAV